MTKWILLRKIKREKREGEGKIERNKRLDSFNVSRVSRLRKLLLGFEVKNRVSSTDLLKKKKKRYLVFNLISLSRTFRIWRRSPTD